MKTSSKTSAPKKNPSRAQLKKLFEAASKKYGVPVQYIEGVSEMESGWRQFNQSGHVLRGSVTPDDQGIMQINERAHPAAFPMARDSTSFNINYGAALLEENYKRYGDWKEAIAAYNWGSAQYKPHSRTLVNETYADKVLAFAKKFIPAKT